MRRAIFAGLVVLVAAVGVWLARPPYKRWKQDLSLAESWGWASEEEQLGWLIIQRFPSERRLLGLLGQLYTLF
jgi:hypothetical protein